MKSAETQAEEKKSNSYFAFISYSRKDLDIAKYIQKSLENFRYKGLNVKDGNKPNAPVYLRKIFLDKTDLSYKIKDYRQGLQQALDHSRYP